MGKKSLNIAAVAFLSMGLVTTAPFGSGPEAASPAALQNSSLFYGDVVQVPLNQGLEAIAQARHLEDQTAERLKVQFTFAFYDRVDAWMRRHADPQTGSYDPVDLQIFLYDWVADTVSSPRFALPKSGPDDQSAFQDYARKDAGLPPRHESP